MDGLPNCRIPGTWRRAAAQEVFILCQAQLVCFAMVPLELSEVDIDLSALGIEGNARGFHLKGILVLHFRESARIALF